MLSEKCLSQFMTILHLYDVDNKRCINLQETTRTKLKFVRKRENEWKQLYKNIVYGREIIIYA